LTAARNIEGHEAHEGGPVFVALVSFVVDPFVIDHAA
jgi:hypothetical protein